jgi:tetratricopeptide (TPR) repeat protein
MLGSLTAPGIYDIGEVHYEVTTNSAESQLWFDRGLGLTYGFNHEEAVVCYDKAAAADPDCAMAYWGKAYALGPNYNAPVVTEEASQGAHAALQQALVRMEGCRPIEQDLIQALKARYVLPPPEDRSELEQAYAAEMRKLFEKYPDDATVAALTAESLMQLRPWKLWSHEGVPAPETAEIRGVLEPSLARWPNHPALCHLYIHAMEASPEVDKAVPAARALEIATPGLGHLVHMPSHIYVWTGRYDDVVRTNIEAVARDDAFVAHAGRENFYTGYRVHNYHFVAYGGMWEGRRELAMEYAQRLTQEIPASLLTAYADLFDIFMATPYHVMVRFGLWNELLDEPAPADDLLATKPVWHYARGVAFASLGRVEEAEKEQELFLQARAVMPESRQLFNNPVSSVLAVGEKVLAGEIEYRKGNYEPAFALLREAVALDEKLNYDEPWGWMEPARHALGALLTEQGRYEEATKVYERNLERYPENGWALHGLAECMRSLGDAEKAADYEARFEKAWARSDTVIPGSCFCKTVTS